MALFLVAATMASAGKVGKAIEEHYPQENYSLSHGQWLISAHGKTAEQVSRGLDIGNETSDPTMLALVVRVGSYWGRHNRDLWEWMKVKLETQNG